MPGSKEELGQTSLSPGAGTDVTDVTGPCTGRGTVSLPPILALHPRPQPFLPQVKPGCHMEADALCPHWLWLLPLPQAPR